MSRSPRWPPKGGPDPWGRGTARVCSAHDRRGSPAASSTCGSRGSSSSPSRWSSSSSFNRDRSREAAVPSSETAPRAFLANRPPLAYRSSPHMKSRVPARYRTVILLLVALLSCAMALAGMQPVHSHENGRLGLYNAECPLAQLGAVHADGWAPPSPAVPSPSLSSLHVALVAPGWAPNPPACLADSRAPPLV